MFDYDMEEITLKILNKNNKLNINESAHRMVNESTEEEGEEVLKNIKKDDDSETLKKVSTRLKSVEEKISKVKSFKNVKEKLSALTKLEDTLIKILMLNKD